MVGSKEETVVVPVAARRSLRRSRRSVLAAVPGPVLEPASALAALAWGALAVGAGQEKVKAGIVALRGLSCPPFTGLRKMLASLGLN